MDSWRLGIRTTIACRPLLQQYLGVHRTWHSSTYELQLVLKEKVPILPTFNYLGTELCVFVFKVHGQRRLQCLLDTSTKVYRNTMTCNVYRVAYLGAAQDHHAIFVEMEDDGSGIIFQVRGNIQHGMKYESKSGRKPDESASFVSKSSIGTISAEDISRVDSVCQRIPPPCKQFNGPKRINPNVPLRRCQEWTQEVIQALRNEAILK